MERERKNEVEVEVEVYSRTFHKWLSGRLWEMVAYKNRTTGVSSEKMYGHIYFMESNLLQATSKLQHV